MEYRLYILLDGHVGQALEFLAEHDQAAIAHAEELRADRHAELWNRARMVTSFAARQHVA